MLWWAVAAAAEVTVVGFSASGQLVTVAQTHADVVRVETFHTGTGTWNHLPVEGTSLDDALAKLPSGAAVTPSQARPGTSLPRGAVGSRDHRHDVDHELRWQVRTDAGVAALSVVETPGSRCGVGQAVTPSMQWMSPAGVTRDLLADRVPARWPTCAVSFDVVDVQAGPRGAIAVLVRLMVVDGEEVEPWWTIATVPGASR